MEKINRQRAPKGTVTIRKNDHVMVDFEKYHVSEISKDLEENYIN